MKFNLYKSIPVNCSKENLEFMKFVTDLSEAIYLLRKDLNAEKDGRETIRQLSNAYSYYWSQPDLSIPPKDLFTGEYSNEIVKVYGFFHDAWGYFEVLNLPEGGGGYRPDDIDADAEDFLNKISESLKMIDSSYGIK